MTIKTSTITIKTSGDCDIVDITRDIASEIINSNINDGIVTVFVIGSTAGVTTIEFESGLIKDMKNVWERNAPHNIPYEHNKRWGDGNGHAHIRASMLGASLVIPFNNKTMALGTWQQVVIIDFDNRPRTRKILLQIMGE